MGVVDSVVWATSKLRATSSSRTGGKTAASTVSVLLLEVRGRLRSRVPGLRPAARQSRRSANSSTTRRLPMMRAQKRLPWQGHPDHRSLHTRQLSVGRVCHLCLATRRPVTIQRGLLRHCHHDASAQISSSRKSLGTHSFTLEKD